MKFKLYYSADTQTWTLEKRLSNHNIFWKQKNPKLFCKWTNNIHKFEGRFLKGQVSSNGLKFTSVAQFNLYFYWSVYKKLENLLLSENVVIGQSSSECPTLSVCTESRDPWKRDEWLLQKGWSLYRDAFYSDLLTILAQGDFCTWPLNRERSLNRGFVSGRMLDTMSGCLTGNV